MTPPSTRPLRLGILVPSSNTALEPLTTQLLLPLHPTLTVHFSRFPVTQIALTPSALSQFDDTKILAAAVLLADAAVDVIGWSGTSAGWLGLEADRRLCARIKEVTGVQATTSVLGLCHVLEEVMGEGERRFGLVTPYLDDVQDAILKTFSAEGYEIVAESHLRRTVNVEFADVDEETLDRQMEHVMERIKDEDVKVVSTFCTNLRSAQRVSVWEEKYPGLIVADTVATVIWEMLRMVGLETSIVKGWGKMFDIKTSK
ncbi:hypothetical protein M409DRAFT_19706 [Zasmidium cellare ATCC 36951]|uniref:Asp/Glu/hydantoin racemase n=1 Tax=Zasmidium cellare ATCC 36951 TaxID=1080233 RepID=A0A6A6CWC5_ZASCE|nr:uncharacterized protein M409DRAFT_19706 [Zasmidium cellare ATCC 36951]KAF2170099.1 hypothetical protein M409DRAFT_19706 [Zasmidium cellare ATCC 36951]